MIARSPRPDSRSRAPPDRLRHQRLHREITLRIGPRRADRPAGAARERRNRFDAVFVAVLGVDGPASAEIEAFARGPPFLAPQAGEMHLDSAQLTIIEDVRL